MAPTGLLPPSSPIHLLVSANDRLSLRGLTAILCTIPSVEIAATALSLEMTLALLQSTSFDVLIFETSETESPNSLVHALYRREERLPLILILEKTTTSLLRSCLRYHPIALFHHNFDPEVLEHALPLLLQGFSLLNERSLQKIATFLPSADFDVSAHEVLTAREQTVLGYLAQGHSNKEIAQVLHISEHTVKFHVSEILAKLNAESRTEAVATAIRQGLIPL